MNALLQINKKIILIIILIITIIFLFNIFFKMEKTKNEILSFNVDRKTSYDILKPKFIINNSKQIINISANEGNFINENEVLLQNDVLFESKKFKILSTNVLFDKVNQTANSRSNSTFISKKTKIKSKGFNIIDQGNTIEFKGKTLLLLSK